ncbi:phosphotransferase [Actinomadura madurae]|uniref:phosphotransferase n=1 Tax=Actinomadura madurae TaxID=1993 RepID=UPI0020D23781|nr:phosphotransferase [Actinomadura madurae]MCP9955864.1 phosphotransferase [Actinomadura madurae]
MQPEQIDRALVDFGVLAGWMDGQGLPGGPFEDVEVLTGGTQNTLVRFRRGGREYVLRRGPGHLRPRTNDVLRREARVLAALDGTDVPAPRLVAACPDESVMGGAVFYLMTVVEGFNASVTLPERHAGDASVRREMGLNAARALAALGAVDHEAAACETSAGRRGSWSGRWAAGCPSSIPTAPWTATPGRTSPAWTTWPAGWRSADRGRGVPGSCTATTTWPT